MSSFKLQRTVQCAKCPWKVTTNPHEIPDGYSVDKHKGLSCTINEGLRGLGQPLHVMACHHGDEEYCIGWLVNQLGVGNNIPLRLKMLNCENIADVKIKGRQHQRFEDTLP
jgi:hypothetical protein